jgi:parvulin-like peptidyl-prolyl isomerase
MASSIDGVGGLAHIASLIRSAVQQRAPHRAARLGSAEKSRGVSGRALRDVLEQRIREIDGDEARRKKLLTRMLIEAVLLEQFGHELGGEVEFQAVVDDVLTVLVSNAMLMADMENVSAALLQATHGGSPRGPSR